MNELESVTVSPYNLSGDLLSDMKKIEEKVFNFDDAEYQDLKASVKKNIVYDNSSSILVSVILLPLMPLDIDAVYKQLSGYYKTLDQPDN